MSKIFTNFFEGLFNIFLFLPYFFSIPTLTRTLFSPWRRLVAKKEAVGFSFGEWGSRLSFNFISRLIGFFMRLSIIIFFLLLEMLFLLLLPVIVMLFVLIWPFLYFLSTLGRSDAEKKAQLEKDFISTHALDKKNVPKVQQWFTNELEKSLKKTRWWELQHLFSIPPLARDWAVGYTPTLERYTEDLTAPDYQNKIRTLVGRRKELEDIQQILSKSEEANVLLVGEEGVGRQTIVDSLAKRIYEGKSNAFLNYKRVLKLNLEAILTEHLDQNERENFLEQLFQEASDAKNIIFMITDLDKYVSQGSGRTDLSVAIEKFAKRSTLQFIATATPFNFEKYIFPNAKISQLFTKIDLKEIDEQQAETILLHVALDFEKRYQLIIPYETVHAVIEKSEFYITHVPFPEKAIELLDSTCAYTSSIKKQTVIPNFVDIVVSNLTHAPTQLNEKIKKTLLDFEHVLATRIVAQNNAMSQLSSALRRAFVLLGKRKKPLASFLFLGPTGVGKTETAKALASVFFEDEKNLIRFDMSLYQSKEDIPKLIGSIESQNPGLLTQAIRDKTYGILLLDEIEKANRDLLNIFLTILDEGYFTDGTGHRVDCKNLIIIATSNAGSDFIFKQLVKQGNDLNYTQLGSSESGLNKQSDSGLIQFLVEGNFFSPEFLNRFDGIILFQPLSQEALIEIAKKIVLDLVQLYKSTHKITLNVSDQTLENLVSKGYHPEFGARNLQRTIATEIEGEIAKKILSQSVREGGIIQL